MRADEFAARVATLAPSVEQLRSEGLDLRDAEKMRSSYLLGARKSAAGGANPLLDLVNTYDASTLEVGMISFGERAIETDAGWIVGSVEADDLLVKRDSGEVVVRELHQDHVLWRCAVNGDAFLDAVLEVATWLEACGRGEVAEGDSSLQEAAGRCAILAGGSAYTDFYKMLLGV